MAFTVFAAKTDTAWRFSCADFFRRHPEWWCAAPVVVAWFLLALRYAESAAGAHAASIMNTTIEWDLMVVAMMLPLVMGRARDTALRSLWRRRHRAMVSFIGGYMAVWFAVAVPIALLLVVAHASLSAFAPAGVAVAFAVATLWQVTPMRTRALHACHRPDPLAPQGWRADRDCIRSGLLTGVRCLVSCWAIMLAIMLAGHSFTALGAGVVFLAMERNVLRAEQRARAWRVLAGAGLVYSAIALLPI